MLLLSLVMEISEELKIRAPVEKDCVVLKALYIQSQTDIHALGSPPRFPSFVFAPASASTTPPFFFSHSTSKTSPEHLSKQYLPSTNLSAPITCLVLYASPFHHTSSNMLHIGAFLPASWLDRERRSVRVLIVECLSA